MSAVRYFDSVPHIVRYGMHDEKEGKSWTHFYRNGICFNATVSREDVSGTPFLEPWLDLIQEAKIHEGPKSWVRQWEMLCDCVITPCLPLLETLAPSSHQWVTLADYLHTPTYDLKLVADEKTANVVPGITDGPTDRPSYEHHLMKFPEISLLPQNVRRYDAESLLVLGKEKNWRRPPHKVRAPNGDVFFFRPCNQPATHVDTGLILNPALDIINAYSRLYSQSEEVSSPSAAEEVHIPRLQGVVVSYANAGPEQSSTVSLASGEGQAKQEQKEELCAGIVLNYVSHAKTLADLMEVSAGQAQAIDLSKYRETWKEQIASVIRHLHYHRITIGSGAGARYLISRYTIYITNIHEADDDLGGVSAAELEAADAWLMLEAGCTVHPSTARETDNEKLKEQEAIDWAALEEVFQF
ncbi:uncharacterized protein A1O5_10618 [Cladophialophora psammophila CBS 110553]|uniref:Uncharacterized protein n=1 Tax=Cladophialophora psammophila CBS 110553 TaxID=1182543 RepID=W9WP88_9EURO|nr:uncharacterized protein A1O5_10618 [Cladophialophora psammophila CBS 110553]EXJ66466.1 hypothetical protein A1O5_10618 [Cladophialophora psammophila CBS 110553]